MLEFIQENEKITVLNNYFTCTLAAVGIIIILQKVEIKYLSHMRCSLFICLS